MKSGVGSGGHHDLPTPRPTVPGRVEGQSTLGLGRKEEHTDKGKEKKEKERVEPREGEAEGGGPSRGETKKKKKKKNKNKKSPGVDRRPKFARDLLDKSCTVSQRFEQMRAKMSADYGCRFRRRELNGTWMMSFSGREGTYRGCSIKKVSGLELVCPSIHGSVGIASAVARVSGILSFFFSLPLLPVAFVPTIACYVARLLPLLDGVHVRVCTYICSSSSRCVSDSTSSFVCLSICLSVCCDMLTARTNACRFTKSSMAAVTNTEQRLSSLQPERRDWIQRRKGGREKGEGQASRFRCWVVVQLRQETSAVYTRRRRSRARTR